ncbi:MAG: hypothetical protein BAJATHORv1_50067 [Candidatus Thorarchaeota archaeon]|nr:MAG: hypothetical protein BAJATHORv1_50067 [Candidatus Thorarchaeota archaeon]
MTEKSKVYYGSVIAGQPERFANPSEKLDKILENLDLSTIEKRDKVAIKMHLGFNDGYQTIPVFFVRRIAKAIKEQGGFPFVTDNPTAVYNAAARGYTSETCGCPLIPIAGVKDGYTTQKEIGYKGVDDLDAAGVLLDADVLVNLSHTKGHGTCGYGGAFKNLALGGYSGPSRWRKIHGVEQFDTYFDKDKMTKEHILKLREACPLDAPNWNDQTETPSLAFYACDQCHGAEKKPCEEADSGLTGWTIKEENFYSFQELMAHATKTILDSFKEDKMFHINVMMDITPFCDCMGMGMPQVIPDVGIAGSRDIVAVEYASLDLIAGAGLIEGVVKQIPKSYMRINPDLETDLHPFQILHGPFKNPYKVAEYGESMGLGSRDYDLVEILSPEETAKMDSSGHTYEGGPSFF